MRRQGFNANTAKIVYPSNPLPIQERKDVELPSMRLSCVHVCVCVCVCVWCKCMCMCVSPPILYSATSMLPPSSQAPTHLPVNRAPQSIMSCDRLHDTILHILPTHCPLPARLSPVPFPSMQSTKPHPHMH